VEQGRAGWQPGSLTEVAAKSRSGFQYFYRADKSRSAPGVGLGLSLVNAIVSYTTSASPYLPRMRGGDRRSARYRAAAYCQANGY
jgi:hypothetical protein